MSEALRAYPPMPAAPDGEAGYYAALPAYLDPLASATNPIGRLSPAEQAALGFERLQHDAARMMAFLTPAAQFGGQRAWRDVAQARVAAGGLFVGPVAGDYHLATSTLRASAHGALGLGAPARNLSEAEFAHYATQDLAQRGGLAATGVATEIVVPTAAFLAGNTVAGLPGGLLASLGAGLLVNNEPVREHAQLRGLTEVLSSRFVTGSASRHPLGRGFARDEQAEVATFLEREQSGETFFDEGEITDIFQGGALRGLFDAVRSTEDFKRRFRDVKDALKLVMQTLHESLEEGMDTLGALQSAGFGSTDRVRGVLQQATAAASLSGVSTGVAVQQALTTAEAFRGTGVRMSFGAELSSANLSMAGAMVGRGGVDLETVRQLGGVQGVATALTGMQTSAVFDNVQAQRALMGAFQPGGGLDPEALGRFLSGEDDVFDVAGRAQERLFAGETNYFAFLGARHELIGQLPPEAMTMMAAAPVLNVARRLQRVMPEGFDAYSEDTLRGIALHMGIAENPAEADLLVSSIQQFRETDVNTMARAQIGSVLREEVGDRRELLPTEQLTVGWRRARQRVDEVFTGAFDRMEGALVERIEAFRGIHRYQVQGVDEHAVRAARQLASEVYTPEQQAAQAELANVNARLAGMVTRPEQEAQALEARLRELEDDPPVSADFAELHAYQQRRDRLRDRISNLHQLAAEGRPEEIYTSEQLAEREQLLQRRQDLESLSPEPQAVVAGQIQRIDEQLAAIRPPALEEAERLEAQLAGLQERAFQGGFAEVARRQQEIEGVREQLADTYRRIDAGEGLSPEQLQERRRLLARRDEAERELRGAQGQVSADTLQRLTHAGFLGGLFGGFNNVVDDREALQHLVDQGLVDADLLEDADELFEMGIGHGAGRMALEREDAGRILDLVHRTDLGHDVSGLRERLRRQFGERYGQANAQTLFRELDLDLARGDDSDVRTRSRQATEIGQEVQRARQVITRVQELFAGDHEVLGEQEGRERRVRRAISAFAEDGTLRDTMRQIQGLGHDLAAAQTPEHRDLITARLAGLQAQGSDALDAAGLGHVPEARLLLEQAALTPQVFGHFLHEPRADEETQRELYGRATGEGGFVKQTEQRQLAAMARVNDALERLSGDDLDRIRQMADGPGVGRAFAAGAAAGGVLGLPAGPVASAVGALAVGSASALYALGADDPGDERAAMAFLAEIGPGLGVSEEDAQALRAGDISSDRLGQIVAGLGSAERQQVQEAYQSVTGRPFEAGENLDPHFRQRLSVEQLMARAGRGMEAFRTSLQDVEGTQDLIDRAQSLLGLQGVDEDLSERIFQFASARQEGDQRRTQELRRGLIADIGGEGVGRLQAELDDEDSQLGQAFGEVYRSRAAAATRMSFLQIDRLTGEEGLGDRLFRQALTDRDEQELVRLLGGGQESEALISRVAAGEARPAQLEEVISKLARRAGLGEDTEAVSFEGGISERTVASLAVTEKSLRSLASMIEALDRRVTRMER